MTQNIKLSYSRINEFSSFPSAYTSSVVTFSYVSDIIAINMLSMIKGMKRDAMKNRIQRGVVYSSVEKSPYINKNTCFNYKINGELSSVGSWLLIMISMLIANAKTPKNNTIAKGIISLITSISNLIKDLVEENILKNEITLTHTKKVKRANMYPGT